MFQSNSFQSNAFAPASSPDHTPPGPGKAELEPYVPVEIYPFVPFYLIQTRKLGIAPFVSAPVVNNPTPNQDQLNNLIAVLETWQPDYSLLPQLPRHLPPQITAVRVDNPPFARQVPFQYPDTPFQLPQTAPHFPQQFVAVTTQTPYNNSWQATVLSAWQPDYSLLPQLPRLLNPQLTAVRVDNPPGLMAFAIYTPPDYGLPQQTRYLPQPFVPTTVPYRNNWLDTVLQAWQVSDPLPTLPRKLSPGIPGLSVDNPPFVRPVPSLYPEIPFQLPQTGPHYPQQFVAATVQTPYANAWQVTVLQAWQPTDITPQLQRKLPPQLIAVRVDNPPFSSRTQLPNILQAWEPPPPLPTPSVTFKIIQPGTTPTKSINEWLIRWRRRGRR